VTKRGEKAGEGLAREKKKKSLAKYECVYLNKVTALVHKVERFEKNKTCQSTFLYWLLARQLENCIIGSNNNT